MYTCLKSTALLAALAVLATPALARTQGQEPDREPESTQERPITNREIDAVDVATTPMNDLNLRRDKIPQVLIDAQADPYSLNGAKKCKGLIAQVNDLNVMLGPDLDLPQEQRATISAGRVARSVVGSFIPFRGIIREVSGANAQDRKIQAAIEAGLSRRGFLKGIGEARGCKYPARSASARDVAAFERDKAAAEAEKDAKEEAEDNKPSGKKS